MQVSVEATQGLEKRMTVELPAEKIEGEVKKRLQSMQPKLKLKGFRPGKVPMSVVEKQYSSQVRQEVTNDVISSSFYEAVANENLKPAGMPKIEDQEATDSNLKYTAVFEVYPEIELNDVSELKIEKVTAEITESDIDDMVEKLRKQRTEWKTVDRAAENGDKVTCDYKGMVDGESFAGGEGTDLPVVIGSNGMIDGFEDALLGATVGQTVEMDLKFPENYQSEDVAGKDVHFTVTVKSIEEPILPEVDDEFVKAFGVEEGGVEAFRAELKSNMERELEKTVKNKVKDVVMDALLAANDIEIPRTMIEQESARVAEQMNEQVKQMNPNMPAGMQQFKAEHFEDQGKRRVALGLLLSELIKANDIKASADKVRAEIDKIAASYHDPKEVVAWYYQDKNRLAEVESMVLEDQVVDWILDNAQVTDNMTTFEEIMKDSR